MDDELEPPEELVLLEELDDDESDDLVDELSDELSDELELDDSPVDAEPLLVLFADSRLSVR